MKNTHWNFNTHLSHISGFRTRSHLRDITLMNFNLNFPRVRNRSLRILQNLHWDAHSIFQEELEPETIPQFRIPNYPVSVPHIQVIRNINDEHLR